MAADSTLCICGHLRDAHQYERAASTWTGCASCKCGRFIPKEGAWRRFLKEEGEPAQPIEQRLLPMQFKLGDRLEDETGEYEVVGRPHTTAAGQTQVRVQRVDNAEITIRSWGVYERIAVRRRLNTR
jgi:hypothetical protein